MQPLQIKPMLNWLFKLICSKYMKDTCTEKSEMKNIDVPMVYSSFNFSLIISILAHKSDRETSQIE